MEVLEPFRKQYLRECELVMPGRDLSAESCATLAGVLQTDSGPVLKEVGKSLRVARRLNSQLVTSNF